MDEAGNERIVGSYQLEERVGRGGMGEVWRARHTRLGSERAVKLLPANLATEPDFLKRFEREAASASRLDHPNILAVYEYGESNGVPYLVMPYIKGGTLKERMAAGPVPREEALNYLKQAAEALDYAHEQGLVHRDVKPANLLLDGRGRLYLADFGIAKALEGAEGLTRTGVGVGTPEYMAPEQAQGRADQRSDLYALGVVLYQLLTGRVPYSGNSTVEVLMKHLQDPLPLLPLRNIAPTLPARVEQVVTKALAKNPNDRYASGKAMVEDLQEAFTNTSSSAAADPAATVVGTAPPTYFSGQTPPPGNTPPQGWQSPAGQTPPPGNAATVAATSVPAWQTPASNTPLPGGTPPGGSTPPPYNAGGPSAGSFGAPPQGGSFGTPPPGGAPPTNNMYGGPPAGGQPPKKSGGKGLLFGILGGLGLLFLLCIGGIFALSRLGGGDPTPTVVANTNPTATTVTAANLGATQTANAPRPSASAAGVPSAAPSVAPSAAPSVAPSAAPSSSSIPLFPSGSPAASASAAPSAVPSAAPTPRPSVAPSAVPSARPSVAPSVAPTPRPSTAAGNRTPRGTAPAGWKTYSGNAKVPFAMYYPPDWTVDDSRANEGRIYFFAPGIDKPYENELWVLIATTGEKTNVGIDVLRDQYFQNDIKSSHPEAGINVTRNNQFSGITFASLGTNFNSGSQLCYAYIGLGLNQNVPWRFRLNSDDADYDKNLDTYFDGMIGSLNIYANP